MSKPENICSVLISNFTRQYLILLFLSFGKFRSKVSRNPKERGLSTPWLTTASSHGRGRQRPKRIGWLGIDFNGSQRRQEFTPDALRCPLASNTHKSDLYLSISIPLHFSCPKFPHPGRPDGLRPSRITLVVMVPAGTYPSGIAGWGQKG